MTKEQQNQADIDALIEQCRNGNGEEQIDAMRALDEANARSAVPAILPLLASEDEWVRDRAVIVLSHLGQDHLESVGPAIEKLLEDPSEFIRNEAAEAFCLLPYPAARPSLERMLLHDPYWVARASAAMALGELGDPRALGALEQALDDEPDPIRSYVVYAIGQLGDARLLSMIQRQLERETHPVVRAELLAVALRWGDEPAFDKLLALLHSVQGEPVMLVEGTLQDLLERDTPAIVKARMNELPAKLRGPRPPSADTPGQPAQEPDQE